MNQERSDGKTDDKKLWHAPTKALLKKYPKGETTMKILGSGFTRSTNRGKKRKKPVKIEKLCYKCGSPYIRGRCISCGKTYEEEPVVESEVFCQEGNEEKCIKIAEEMKMFGLQNCSLYIPSWQM